MPATLSYPGVYIEELQSGVRTITGVATSIAAFVGWSAKGPTDRAVRVFGFDDYVKTFGDLDTRSYLGYAVLAFFLNGGQDAYVVRLAVTPVAATPAVAATNTTPAIAAVAALPGATAAGFTFNGKLTLAARNPGAWANDYRVRIERSKSETDTGTDMSLFKLLVLRQPPYPGADPIVVESFDRLSLDPANGRYIGKVLDSNSRILRATIPANPPAGALAANLDYLRLNGTAAPELNPFDTRTPKQIYPKPDTVTFPIDGVDGDVLDPTATVAADLAKFTTALNTGRASTADGLRLLEKVNLFNILCVPGLSDPTAVSALQAFCYEKRAFYIVDPAADDTFDGLSADAKPASAVLASPVARNSALYFPWVLAPDPKQEGRVRKFPPSGAVAGVYARTDTNRGVWKAPAGTEAGLVGVSGLDFDLSDKENGVLNLKGIDCLRTFPVYGNVVWGDRTLVGNSENSGESDYWKIGPRRLTLFIEESLYRSTKWVVFEPNDEPLWAQVRLNVGTFMTTLFRQKAFQGATPREAFQVKCDGVTTTQADIDRGVVNILVKFRPLLSAEFVVIQIQQIRGDQP